MKPTTQTRSPPQASAIALSALSLVLSTAAAAQTAEGTSSGRLFVYPANGQTQAQLDQDRYECHVWARQQSGFDPSNAPPAPPAVATPASTRVRVAENPAAGATATGTLAGAVIGGLIGERDRDALGGAVLGAAVGGLAGGTVEMEGERKVQRAARDRAEALAARQLAEDAQAAQHRTDYRRAISACLEGRGYTVR